MKWAILQAGSEPVALAADGMLAYFAENGIENTQQERMDYINSLKAAFGGREDSFR